MGKLSSLQLNKLPKLQLKKGAYLGYRGYNETYDADYYIVKEVQELERVAKANYKYARKLQKLFNATIKGT